jgi:copper homeostasis protein
MLLEVVVQSVDDAREATRGGAGRLEVVRSINDGGLTPPLALVRAIAAETPLPLRVMVRENAGYSTDPNEVRALRRALEEFAELGVDGIVIGFANGGEPALDDLAEVLRDAPPVRVTFHRAFDAVRDPLSAIDRIVTVPQVDRILTSGGTGSRDARAERLRDYSTRAGQRIRILAGGDVDREMLRVIAATRCVSEVHVASAARANADPNGPVSATCVRELVKALGPAKSGPHV